MDEDLDGAALLVTYTVGHAPLTRQGVAGIYRRVALAAAAAAGIVRLPPGELDDAVAALSTALRYGRRLQAQSGVAARVLARVRA